MTIENFSSEEESQKHGFRKYLPKVVQTKSKPVKFEESKIYCSLLRETPLSKDVVSRITELTVRRIASSGIKFVSGPHIREIVCSILAEQGYEEERKLYTRIGIPVANLEVIINEYLRSVETLQTSNLPKLETLRRRRKLLTHLKNKISSLSIEEFVALKKVTKNSL